MTADAHVEELTGALRAADVPGEQIDRTAAELRGHLAETGAAPEEEFGSAARFAARPGGLAPAPGEPDGAAEHWAWTADLFDDRRMPAVHGDQGWEVESLDAAGRFVCRRAPGAALVWEYRREVITDRRRAQVPEELEPEDREPCGEWLPYGCFKRPKVATTGPEGRLEALPARPRGWLFPSRRGKVLPTVRVLAVLVCPAVALSGLGLPGRTIALCGFGYAISMTYTAKKETEKGRVHADRAATGNDGNRRSSPPTRPSPPDAPPPSYVTSPSRQSKTSGAAGSGRGPAPAGRRKTPPSSSGRRTIPPGVSASTRPSQSCQPRPR